MKRPIGKRNAELLFEQNVNPKDKISQTPYQL